LEAVTPDTPLSTHDASALVERAAGNPLFLGELVQASRGADVGSLPSSVEALMAAQIDRLPPPDRQVLRYASVFGNRFPVDLAERVLAQELRAAGGREAWARLEGLLEPEGSLLRFRHALVRDAAYEGLPYSRRKAVHLRVAETVEGDGTTRDDRDQLLSFHFWNGGDAAKTWRYSVAAGRQAQAAYANTEAAEFYRRAVGSVKTLPLASEEVADVYRSLAKVHELVGEYREAIVALRAERRLVSGDPLTVGRSLLREARLYDRLESWSQVLRRFTRAANLVAGLEGEEADRLRAELEVGYAAIKMSQGHHASAIAMYEHAIPIAEASGAREVVAHAAHLLDRAYAELGRPEDAPYPGLALRIAEEHDDLELIADACDNMGLAAYYRGDWDDAVELYERARDAAHRMGNEWSAGFGTHNIAEIRSDQGRLDEAEPLFTECLRVWRAAEFSQGVAFARMNLGLLAARAGRADEALSLLADGRAEFAAKGADASVVEADVKTSQALLLQGQAAAAMGLAHDAAARAASLDGAGVWVPMARRVAGEASFALGDLDDARQELEEALGAARANASRYEEALSLRACSRAAVFLEEGDPEALRARSDAMLEHLGVVRVAQAASP
jgi:tetratricopeptide (TPR) repeat protein